MAGQFQDGSPFFSLESTSNSFWDENIYKYWLKKCIAAVPLKLNLSNQNLNHIFLSLYLCNL